ncbi:MAG: metal ABC transporter substrate-binding protein [Actinomycetota bacterium]|nr:metal ABC transporter substrate-binding protein [Actinomycetota bacterium]
MTRRVVASLLGVVLTLVASSCGSDGADDSGTSVVAGFARLAELASAVGGPGVEVRDLTPSGAEPHDLELSSDDVDAVEDADLTLYLGGDFQPAVAEVADRADRAVDLLERGEEDPHIWLDPPRFARAADQVASTLAAADPAGRAGYLERAAAFRRQVEELDARFRSGLDSCQRRVIVTAHAAFGRLASRYGLRQEAITGLSPEAEPSPARLAELDELVRRERVTHVFTERLVSRRVAEALAREAGVEVAVLDPLEGRLDGGYVAAMDANLATLREVLGCGDGG